MFTRLKSHHVKQCKYRVDSAPRLGWIQHHHKSETYVDDKTAMMVTTTKTAPAIATVDTTTKRNKNKKVDYILPNGCDDDVSWMKKKRIPN